MWVSPLDAAQPAFEPCTEIPLELRPFAKVSAIAQERVEDFERLRAYLIADVQPRSFLEWLWTFDLAEICWEILYCREMKAKALCALREAVEEGALRGTRALSKQRRCRGARPRDVIERERVLLFADAFMETVQRRWFVLLKEMNTNRAFKARAVAYIQSSHC
jgi:hypothetical protein